VIILWIQILSCRGEIIDDNFGKTEFQKLDATPFEVPLDENVAREGRIVYGWYAFAGQFPHFALIYVNRPTTTVQCSAGLIAPQWVLTANHCVNSAVSIELRLGSINRYTYEQIVYAAAYARLTEGDIALVQLKTSVNVTALVRPALLPRLADRNNMYADRIATVCGMGIENQQTNAVSTYLMYTNLKIMSQLECRPYYGDVAISMMCAKATDSLASTCPGDSGSPLTIMEDGNPVIIGIVSFGAASGCDLGFPVGYGRTTAQLEWIAYYTGFVLRK